MNSRDSDDDSSDDGNDYTETKVLLGYASKEATDDTFSQLGGHPSWLDEATAPPAHLAKCAVCHGLLSLLLQLHGDLPNQFPAHERRLYVLACKKNACRRKTGSVRAFRAVRASDTPQDTKRIQEQPPQEQPPTPKPLLDLGSSIFGGKPLVSKPAAVTPSPPTTSQKDAAALSDSFASKASISDSTPPPPPPIDPWPQLSDFPSPYPTYHLDAEYESLNTDQSANGIPAQAKLDMETDGSSTDPDMQTAFESSMDTTFQKFADRMSQNPDQVLRYEFGGTPLLYCKTEAFKKVTRCGNCGSERTFEMQLTPNAIVELEDEVSSLDGMDWGTIVLMVCAKDCVPRYMENETGRVGYQEEWVGVQWEDVVNW